MKVSSNKNSTGFQFFSRLPAIFTQWIENRPISEYLRTILSSVLIGVVVALSVQIFFKCIDIVQQFFFTTTPTLFRRFPGWCVFIFPVIGGLLVGIMTLIAPENASQKGVSEIIKSNFLNNGLIRFKTTLFHFFASILFIGSGGTLGPEDSSAQLGAGMASLLGQTTGVSEKWRRAYIAAGMSAAIAAIFNAPIGAVLFSLEIILFNFFQTFTFSMLIISALTADYVSKFIMGGKSLFWLPEISIHYSPDLILYLLLGIVAGLVSLFFLKLNNYFKNFFDKRLQNFNPLFKLLPVMLLFGITGIAYPQLFGTGYEAIRNIVGGGETAANLLILTALKLLFTTLLLSAGGFGGLFAPSLFVGAGFGGFFAVVLNHYFNLALNVPAFSVVGMTAVCAGVNSIPMASMMIIVEVTHNYQMILPLFLGVLMSEIVVQYSLKTPVHYLGLKQQGVRPFDGRELNVLKSLKTKQVMSPEFHKISAGMNLKSFIRVITAGSSNIYWVIDDSGKVAGYISFSDMKPIIMENDQVRSLVLVSEVMNRHVVSVTPDDNLDYIIKLFGRLNLEELPVVDPESGNIIGTVYRNRVIQLYNQEIFKRETSGDLATQLRMLDQVRYTDLDEDITILEMPVPLKMADHNLKKLNLRRQWGIQIVLIKRFGVDGKKHIEIPGPDTTILKDDMIIIAGQNRKVHEFRRKNLK